LVGTSGKGLGHTVEPVVTLCCNVESKGLFCLAWACGDSMR